MNTGEESNAAGTRDILTTMIMLMMVFVYQIKVEAEKAIAQADPPGNLLVDVSWPEGDLDVDLWLDGPAEPVPVGYSNKGGLVWNLLRDDLGNGPDATSLNYENAYTRGVVPGSYRVNVMCYRCPVLPVPVKVVVSLNKDAGKQGAKTGTKIILTTTVQLNKSGQERTAVAFTIDANGVIDDSSLNSVFKPLRSAKKG